MTFGIVMLGLSEQTRGPFDHEPQGRKSRETSAGAVNDPPPQILLKVRIIMERLTRVLSFDLGVM